MKLEYFSTITAGQLQMNVRQLIAKELKAFEGKRVSIRIEKVKSKRSLQQNRYIHALFTILKNSLNEFGNNFSLEEVKELCKAKFSLIDVVNEATGECFGQRIKGTAEMNKTEMGEFIDKVIAWAATMNITLPYPNEVIEMDLK